MASKKALEDLIMETLREIESGGNSKAPDKENNKKSLKNLDKLIERVILEHINK